MSVSYDAKVAVRHITLDVPARQITAIIGPSGCGKSTLLRCFNRMNDLVLDARVEGGILFHGQNLYGQNIIMQVQRGEFVTVWPPEFAAGKVNWPPRLRGE